MKRAQRARELAEKAPDWLKGKLLAEADRFETRAAVAGLRQGDNAS